MRLKVLIGLPPFVVGVVLMLWLRSLGTAADLPSSVFVFCLGATVAAAGLTLLWRQMATLHIRRIAAPDDFLALLAMCMRRQLQVLHAYAGITACVVVAYLALAAWPAAR